MDDSMIKRTFLAASALAAACAVAACGGASAAEHPPSTASPAAVQPTAPALSAPAADPPPATRSTATPAPIPRPRVSITRVRTADGALVTIATFLGPVRYVLHNGSADPGPAASGLVRAGPAVTGAERRQLLAAFNGGFKLSAGAGGYLQEGHVISPLRPGFASLVIDRSGRARIGVWGRGLPAPGEAVYSVRQNLQPLVLNGRPTAAAADWATWGATLGGGAHVARSAIGQDATGDLMYAASMSALPADLAAALAAHGARVAMELDINPEWVQLDAARIPGGTLTAEIPGQYRPSDQYLAGWTRDFFAVLAPSASPARTLPSAGQIRPLRKRSQDSPAARARWRADAADDAGFGGDRMEADLDKSGIAQRLLPELRRCRVLGPDAEAVAGQVLRDAPPSADSLGGEHGHLLAQDGTVAPAPAAAEHHVGDDQAAAGTQPLRRARGQRPLVSIGQVV